MGRAVEGANQHKCVVCRCQPHCMGGGKEASPCQVAPTLARERSWPFFRGRSQHPREHWSSLGELKGGAQRNEGMLASFVVSLDLHRKIADIPWEPLLQTLLAICG